MNEPNAFQSLLRIVQALLFGVTIVGAVVTFFPAAWLLQAGIWKHQFLPLAPISALICAPAFLFSVFAPRFLPRKAAQPSAPQAPEVQIVERVVTVPAPAPKPPPPPVDPVLEARRALISGLVPRARSWLFVLLATGRESFVWARNDVLIFDLDVGDFVVQEAELGGGLSRFRIAPWYREMCVEHRTWLFSHLNPLQSEIEDLLRAALEYSDKA